MKVWVKLLTGAILGVVLGFMLPFEENGMLAGAIEFLPRLALRIGRYVAPPLIVFSLTVAIYELRLQGRFWQLLGKCVLVILLTSVIILTFGIGAARLFFSNGRIPIIVESAAEIVPVSVEQSAFDVFPSNMLSVLSGDGLFILPLCVFAFFMAIGLTCDKNHARPMLAFFDSVSRVFFHIAAFVSELIGFVIIVLAASFAWQYRLLLAKGIFSSFIKLLFGITFALVFVVLPLFLYLFRRRKKLSPWAKVYGSFGTAIAAFFSGDINFTLPVLFLHGKENLGMNRQVNTVAPLLYTMIGRSGSAMIAAVSFLVILQSYSSLEISIDQVMQIWIRALLLSLMLGRNSGDGAFAALAALCLWTQGGFETGYLILKPISFLLVACATLIDSMVTMLGSYAVARITPDSYTEKSVRHFI
ncbi:MAG: dicarboxylate/amino acid:cation symporter [Spirochaetaceae bacterium]|jgi:Na+/H+-dicarboxylate symporter|nr:dicarboxylate/amino acid:cation symporter [Spirochaetaceae bacterium]